MFVRTFRPPSVKSANTKLLKLIESCNICSRPLVRDSLYGLQDSFYSEFVDVTELYKVTTSKEIKKLKKEESVGDGKKYSERTSTPTEENIKSGNYIWRGFPVSYNINMKNEARNLTDKIEVGDKFFALDKEGREYVLNHEVSHNIESSIIKTVTFMNYLIFSQRKQMFLTVLLLKVLMKTMEKSL